MSKFGLVDASVPLDDEQDIQIDWGKCMLCQLQTEEKVTNPAHNTRGTDDAYTMLVTNLPKFHDIHAMPLNVDISKLDDGSGMKSTMAKNNAIWHKSCYLMFNNTRLRRAEAKHRRSETSCSKVSPVKTRRSCSTEYVPMTCLFCELPETRSNPLSKVMSKECDEYIRENAKILKDTKVTGKGFERCDLISLDAYYHKNCYTRFRNKVRDQSTTKTDDPGRRQIEALAFAGLVSYLNDSRDVDSDVAPAFSMGQLTKMYAEGMRELGVEYDVHSTRLKKRLLEECPYLQSVDKPGTESLITFREDINSAVRSLCARDFDVESKSLCDAAKTVRADLFQNRNNSVNDDDISFPKDNVPPSMLKLVKLIINGPGTASSRDCGDENDQVAMSLAQLLSFHAVAHRKGATASARRHTRKQETPVPVYVALKLYGETRKKELVDLTYRLGLSISYDRLSTMLTEKANEVCSVYRREGVVCPPALLNGVFTTAAVDNLDHNTSATTAKTSFHGTAISLMQHLHPGQTGTTRAIPAPDLEDLKKRHVMKLPADYAVVPPCFENVKIASCTKSDKCTHVVSSGESSPFSEEFAWLQKTSSEECIPWAAHHAQLSRGTVRHSTNTALMPIFTENAHSEAMMIHTMNVVQKAVHHLNPEQIPVLVADQPLFALLKQIQYTFPATHGEDKFFIFMGGMHIEKTALIVIGQWLNQSGWVDALVQAEVTTQGRAESLISASHITRTRYAHEVTVAVLFNLQQQAYDKYVSQTEEVQPMVFEDWCADRCKKIPQFQYWDIAMKLELLVLQFVRATRTGNFCMYLTSLAKITPWFFALDHQNYARWVSVHVRDLITVNETHPELAKQFQEGLFVARKSERPFSSIALDQAHEQLNALLKGDGGMVGLTESPDALRKWVVAGPELAATVDKFERDILLRDDGRGGQNHHRETACAKKRFARDVTKLKNVFSEMCNPFEEESTELYNIDSKKVASAGVVETVQNIERAGETQYQLFANETLRTGGEKALKDTIKNNKFPLFSNAAVPTLNKSKAKQTALKSDCSLFSQLYISTCEHRSGDLDNFFSHENTPTPPSLSSCGELRSCTKSDLVDSLVDASPESVTLHTPQVHAKFLDGSVIVHMLSPGQSGTFKEYVERVFHPFIQKELASVLRLDLIWDTYDPSSLKSGTRKQRGFGIRTKVALHTKIPKSWPSFLRDSANKEELFKLLASTMTEITVGGKEVNTTLGTGALCSTGRNISGCLAPCNHEEADTRIMVHIADAVAQGNTKVLVRTVDTDVLAIAVSCVQKLDELEELWVQLGTGKNRQCVAAHTIAVSLGPAMSHALPMFHAFSGCDTVSSFCGRGKKSAFEAWKAYPDATNGFEAAAAGNVDEAMPYLEKFVITMYDRSSTCSSVNECRKTLFTKKDRLLENIPPTLDALRQHVRRAAYQGGHVWGQALVLQQQLPSPSDWGWKKSEDGWTPEWITQPVASKTCLELVRCKCKKGCGPRCNCIKKDLKCTDLCFCAGECTEQ